MSDLLLGIVMPVCTCWFHNTATLPPWLVSTDLAHVHTSVFGLIVPLFPCMCWSGVVHSIYRVFLCTVFCQYWACWYYVVYFLIKLLAKSAFAICLAVQYFCRVILFCSVRSWSATISLSVSDFRSPFDSQRNVSSSLISCLSMFLMYCPCITSFFHFSFRESPNLAFVCCIPFFLRHSPLLVDLILL